MSEQKKWLYQTLTDEGYNVGESYEKFDSLVSNNSESREWVYKELQGLGYNLGAREEFEELIAKKPISAEQQPSPTQVAPQSHIVVSLSKTQPVQGGIPKQEATTTPIIAVDNKTEGMVAENETPTAPQAGTPINPSEGVMETPKEEQLNIAPTPQGVTPVAEETTQESLSEQKEIEAQGNQGPIAEVQEAEETKSTPEGEAKEVTLEDVISSHKTALGEGEAVYNDYVVDNIPEWIDQGMLGNPYIYDYNVQTSNIIFNAVRNKMISEGKTPSQDEVVAKIKGMSSEDIDKALTEKDKSKIVAEKNRYESAFINKGEATSILGKAMENEQLRKYLAMAIGKDENASAEDVAIALSATVRGLDGDLRKALDSKNKEYDVVRKALADYYNVKGIFGNDAYDEFMSSEIGKDTDVMNMGQLWRKMFGYANSPLYPRKYKELVTDAMRQVHATHTSDTKEGKEYLNNAIGRIDSYLDVKNQVSPDKMNELLQTINSRLPGTQRLNSWEDVFFYQHPTTYPIPMELTPQGIALDALNSYLNNTLLKDANEGEIKALEARVNERATENMAKTQHKLDSNPLLLLDENKALQTNRASNWGMDQEYLFLKGALDIRKDAYDYGENAGKDESFVSNLWRGFADKAFDIKNWDLGLSKFGEAANLMLIIDKSEKGEELTYAENAFIDAIATDFAVKSITKASRGYKAGMVTAEALPFMAEMLFSPLKGGGAMANKFARLMLKKYGKDTIKKNAGKYLMGKLGSRLLGDLGKAYGMALTTGAMNVGADAINRNVGKVKYNVAEGGKIVALKDEEGKIVTEDAVGGAEAIFDAINSRAIENFSEFTGGYLPGGVWLKSLANKVGLSKAVKYYDKISSTAWAKNADRFFERTQWHGPIEEFNEEMIGGVLNAIVVGDQTLDTAENTGVFNNDNLIDTALGVGVMSVLMSSVKTMGYRTASQQLEAQKKNTIKLGEDVLGDDWADIQSTIDNATAYNLAKELNALLSNNKYSADGKRIIMRYGMEVAEGDALISAEERQQMAYESETKVDNASRLEGSARLGWNTTDANEQYVANKQYEERGNAVVDMLQYDGESADDALLSRYGVSDSYDIADKVSADADLNTKQKQTILGYLDSREQVVAMGQRALRDTQISAVNAVRNDKSNIQSGKTIVATHKVDGHEMYVIDGNVALNEDGTIDVGNSDDSIIVENKETGEREFISPSMFSAVTEQESANAMSDAVSAKSQSYTNAMTYGHTLEQGEDIVIDGVTHKVASVDYDKGVVLFADGEIVDLETLAQDADRRNAERTKAEVVEKVAPKVAEKPQATPTEVNQEVERTAPQQEYTQGKAIVYKDASGNYRMAEVMQEADPDGNIIIIDTFTGDTHQVSSSQLDQWQAEVATETTQEEVPSSQGILDNSIPVAENAPIAVDVTEEVEAENPTATTETQVEVTPQVAEQPQTPTTQVAIPTDEKGNPLYEQMSVEDTISNLYNDPDLEDDEADAFVTNKIAKAQQGVDELAKNKPQMGDNILQFKAEKKQWESQIAEAQRVLDYWNGVKAQRASMKEESTEVAQPQTTPMVEAEEKIEGTPQAEQKQSIKSETTPGIVRNAYSAYVPKEQVEQLDKVAQALGVQIELVPTMRGANAKIVGNKVTVALDAEQIQQEGANGVIMVIGHELTHRIKSLSNEAFEDFASVIESILPEEFKQRMIATRLAYSRQGLKISNEALREEVVADLAGIVMANKGTMEKFLKALEPKSTKQQILDVLKQMFEAIKGVFQGEFAREIAKAEKVLLESMKKASAVVNEGNTIEADNTGSVTTEHKGNTESFTNFYTNRKPTARIGSNTDNQHPSSSQSVSTDKVSDKVGDVQEDSSIVDINEKEGQALFSLRTYNEGGRESLQNFVASQVDKGALTQEQAQEIVEEMETIYDICEQYTGEYAPFGNWSEAEVVRDERGIPVLSVIKANGDYKMNLDFSLVCKKRRTLDAVFQEMINRGVISNFELGQVDIARVNDIIREHGFETACRLCFVDSKRFRTPKVADDFATLYNELVDMSDTQLKKVIKGEAKNTVRKKASKHLLEHPEDRIKVGRDNFITAQGFEQMKKDRPYILSLYNMAKGSGGPKASFGDVQYMNDVQNTNWTPEEAYAVGGVRLQSFSDYVPRMVFDYVQLLADLSAKQLPVHAYTKEPIFAKQFGLSGIKINLSLVPRVDIDGVAPGLDKDGNYAWQEGETFPYDVAVELQNAEGYKENVGTIAVGVSDEHIAKLLDDPNIRMVIPYHKSGLNKQVAIKNNIDAFVDYTNSQNTRKADGTKVAKAGLNGMPDFNQDIHSGMHPREAAQRYLDWCEKKGYLPKFDQFKDHPNYYKMLEDFTTIIEENGEERVVPQGAVSMTFPTENDAFGSMESLIKEGLEEDAILEGNRQAKVGEIVDEIEEVLAKGEQAKYSLRSNSQEVADIIAKAKADGTYMKAPNGEATNLTEEQWANVRTKAFKDWFGDWEKDPKNASKIVDENGEPMVVYHGTRGDINEFKDMHRDDGFYFVDRYDVAEGYAKSASNADSEKETIIPTFLNIRNPRIEDAYGETPMEFNLEYYVSNDDDIYEIFDNLADAKKFASTIPNSYVGTSEVGDQNDLMKLARKQGNDGVVMLNVYDQRGSDVDGTQTNYVAFKPNQIKSATENVGTYSNENDDVRYSLRDTIPFYSNAERAVENIKQGKATPEQWLAMIQKNGGLKAGEDKWLGLSDWLKDSKAKSLTKDEVLEFIKANQIVVEEVNYGGASIVSVQSEFDKLTEEHGNYEGAFEEMVNRYGDDFSMAVWYDEYGQLHLEEGYEDYGEILGMERGINPTRLEYTTQGLENNKEIALVVPSIEPYNQYDEIHFGDAGDGRAVAWVRFGETRVPRQVEVVRRAEGFDTPYKNANGGDVFKVKGRKNDIIVYTPLRDGRKKYIPYVNEKFIGTTEETAFFDTFEEAQEAMNRYYVEHPVYKTVYDNVLVIDEIQSKRHQDGREKGYQGKDIAQRKARIDEIRERLRVISERRSEISDLIPTDIRGILNRANYRKTMPENEEFERLRDEDIALRRELDEITLSISERNAVPDAPFDKNWQELAMKRMLRYAAENGFDKVAWTTGEQQAERYSMVRLFNDIEREDNPNLEGRRFVLSGANAETFQVDDNGNITASTISEAEGKSLQEVVGKEMAIKMMNLEDGDLIENEDLRIGGEGMKGFYDKMLPSFMNKYGKKWGVKVGETTMPNIGDNGLTMHSIDVTDEMKESVMEGQPLFSLRGTTDVQSVATDAVIEMLGNSGIEVVKVSDAEAQEMLRLGGMEMSAKKKRALETALLEDKSSFKGTVIPNADVANILNNLDSLAKKYEEKLSNRQKTFIGELSRELKLRNNGNNSNYATFETRNGRIVTIRVSDHNASSKNMADAGQFNGISIVISRKPNKGITNDGDAHIVEFYYSDKKIAKADGKPLAEIVRSIKQALYSGEFKDTTGLAERQEVNLNNPEFHIVYHGSGAKFNAFDHSHMGEGEGAQAYGWGTYVTENEEVGKTYANVGVNNLDQLQVHLRANKGYLKDAHELLKESKKSGDIEGVGKWERQISELEKEVARLQEEIDSFDATRQLYTVEIPDDDGSNYLHHDKVVASREIARVKQRLFDILSQGDYKGAERELREELNGVFAPGLEGDILYNNVSAYLGGDKQASEFFNEMGYVGIKYPTNYMSGGNRKGQSNYVIFNEADAKIVDRVEFLKTAQGEVYGWTDGKRVYLTEKGMNPETPIHEYTHIWARAMKSKNAKGWQSVKDLLRDTPMWNEVMNDANYADIRENEDAVASEVLSRISGKENAERMMQEAQKMIDNAKGVFEKADAVTLVDRMRRALKEFWSWVGKNLFGIEKFNSIEEVTDRVLYDLVEATELNTIKGEIERMRSTDIDALYPNWLEGTTTESGKHSTQVAGTRKTYNKVGNWIKENMGKDVAILDASSGMGYGTMDLRERGFNIEDVEPYQSEERKQNNPATYSTYDDIEKEYDFIISNAVLNVIPDDWRADVLHNMADLLKEGGHMFINTRKVGEEKSIKDKIELDTPQEVLVKRNGRIASYQRFFTPQELKEWVESELGEGYDVAIANEKNSGTSGLAAVVVTKNTQPIDGEDTKFSLRGVLHPKGDGDYDGTRAEYNRRVGVQKGMRKLGYKFREGHQDSMLSLKILQEIVAKANGKDPKNLPSWQDAYIQENLMSSRNKAEKDIYMRDFFKPLMEEVEKLLKKGMGYEEITQYMIAKHGLERNALMAERVAKEEADKVLTERDNLAKRVARVKANKALEGVAFADWTAKKEAWKQEYESAYNAEKLAEDEAQDLWMKEYKKAIKEAKGRDFSGLTALFDVEGVKEAEIMAQALIDEVERDYNMDSLWNKVRKATQESLATQYKAGLISRQTYDKVRDMYQYYIPLKGFKEMTADEEYEYLVANAPLLPSLDKRAMGRSSVAEDPLATIAMDADAAIIKANRNKMKQAFYHFVKNNPSSLVSINEQWYIKDPVSGKWVVSMPLISADATDEEIQQAIEEHEERMKELAETGDATTKTKDLELDYIALPQHQIEHAVRVKINGKEYVMYINGNPRAAQALNGLTNPEAFNDAVTKFGKKVNNFMAQMFTSGNPAFIFTNGMRDIQWATNAVMIKENVAYQMEYAKCLAKAMQIPRLIIKEGSGSLNMDKETQKYFDEFIRYGGETGYTAIQQIDDYKKKVDQLVNGVKWYDTPLEGAKKVIEGVEYLNRSVEDVTRFAVYMASRKMGRTPERSAYDAKEITVNFNKKGSGIMGARYMGAFYLFYNASVQSLNGLAKLYKQNPIKASARTAMWAGVSAMLPIMNELLIEAWGDDDDKEAYDNLPEWVRKNNLVFYIPGTDAKFFTISLPHEMRPWTTIGYVANEVFSGKMEAGEAFKHITLGFADMLPMDFAGNGGNIVVNLTPTWAQPMTQILFNVDYFGKPVYKNSDYSKNKPEFTTAFKGTSPILVDLSRAVNAIGGGDESKKGSVDVINPDVVQHLVESYFGGVGKTINKSLNTIAMLGDEDMREVKNIPIVSSFMIGNEERTSTGYKANQRYYEIKDEVSKYDDALSIRKDIIMQGVRANATQEEKDKANEYFEKLVEDADSKNTKQYLFAKGYIDYIDKLRRGLDDIDQSRREEVEKNISDAMIELNKGYNKADEKSIEELKKQKEDLSQKARDLIEGWNGKNFIDDTYQNNKWAKKDLNEAVREFNPNALREWKNKHNIVKDK